VVYRFGLFEFDAASGELRKQGRLVRIEPQPAKALALLLSRPAVVISRDELRAHLWGTDTHVDFDRGLAYCIGQVRTALNDSADNPRFVETLPRRGYRFVAPLQPVAPVETPAVAAPPGGASHPPQDVPTPTLADETHPSRGGRTGGWWSIVAVTLLVLTGLVWTVWARKASPRPIVAVAVFDNETGSPQYDRLASTAADIAVERLTALGPGVIGVVGNTPTLRAPRAQRSPAAVQRETGAGYFVFGQLQNDDAGVRLVVHLIRLDDDTHLWVTRVARAPSDLGDIEDVVAERLTEAVRRHVVERDPDAPRFTR
jgi:DNA-binding winged helix-turn-helix (wHTH) protein/TolB-like protein